jgi:hypothetical protein
MLRGNKTSGEIRFELLTWGAVLLTGALMYIVFNTHPIFASMILFIPGLILLGSTLYQDIQLGWKAGWLNYALAILAVATGLGGVINGVLGGSQNIPWLIIAIAELGAILIAKALYDPNPRQP